MPINQFIATRLAQINQFHQDDMDWTTMHHGRGVHAVNEASEKHAWFNQAMKGMHHKLSREAVANYYSQDLYLGFIATLLWGGAHCNRVDHFRSMVSCPPNQIVGIMSDVYKRIQANGMTQNLFASMCRCGANHIDGLGLSFFTKVFYFMALSIGRHDILILDSVMWRVYNDFRIDDNLPSRNNCRYGDYTAYLNYMNAVSGVNQPDQLEAYLFVHY